MSIEIDESIAHWTRLAEDQERAVSEGYACCPQASQAKSSVYRRTVLALQLEKETGFSHCVCCLKSSGTVSMYK
jgi:hypothetical protein